MRAVNLLPPDTRGASKASAELGAGPEAKGGAGAFVVLGVLAACVAGAAGYVLTDNTIKQRKADLAEVAARQQALAEPGRAAQAVRRLRRDGQGPRADRASDLAGSRFDWEQALRDLSRAIPQDVTLRSLAGDISTGAGGGGSALRGAISAPAITLTGCAPGQTQVARLMARLRRHRRRHPRVAEQVRGRARSSDSDDERQRASSSATPRRAASGKRPAFEVVMFFEKAAAAVATTPTTATGTVSATPTPARRPTADAAPGDARPRPRPPRPRTRRREGRPREPYRSASCSWPSWRSPPSAATGSWRSRPSAPRPPSSSTKVAVAQAAARPDAEPDRHLQGRA